MSVTPSQFPVINQVDLDGTETAWVQKNGKDYSLSLDNIKQYGGCDVYCTSLVIPTASVLTLFATPIEIVAAPGAGYAIEVISASMKLTYNSIAYATNTALAIYTDTGSLTSPQILFNSATLASSSDVFTSRGIAGSSATTIIENKSIKVGVQTGNPTAGDSDIKVYVQYRIITL